MTYTRAFIWSLSNRACSGTVPLFLPKIVFPTTPVSGRRRLRSGSAHKRRLGTGAFGQHTKAARHFGISVGQATKIATEYIFVELAPGFNIPKTAAVRADLIGQHQTLEVPLVNPANFDFKVDQADTDTKHHTAQPVIHAQREAKNIVHILLACPTKRSDMLFRYQRITQTVIFVAVLDNRTRQLRAFFNAQTLAHGACSKVAHDHFQRNDLTVAHQLLAHVHTFQEVGWHADLAKAGHEILAQAVVQHTFAINDVFLFRVEGGGVVFEVLHDGARLRAFKQNLGFAFIDFFAAGHGYIPSLPG
mmetsp:Transcript_18160/g.28355  ORF Transcript_18160/g.28355 Transcript_18160/m.28355 type:complete len:304 (-) Transcript_18160:63-974(-)